MWDFWKFGSSPKEEKDAEERGKRKERIKWNIADGLKFAVTAESKT